MGSVGFPANWRGLIVSALAALMSGLAMSGEALAEPSLRDDPVLNGNLRLTPDGASICPRITFAPGEEDFPAGSPSDVALRELADQIGAAPVALRRSIKVIGYASSHRPGEAASNGLTEMERAFQRAEFVVARLRDMLSWPQVRDLQMIARGRSEPWPGAQTCRYANDRVEIVFLRRSSRALGWRADANLWTETPAAGVQPPQLFTPRQTAQFNVDLYSTGVGATSVAIEQARNVSSGQREAAFGCAIANPNAWLRLSQSQHADPNAISLIETDRAFETNPFYYDLAASIRVRFEYFGSPRQTGAAHRQMRIYRVLDLAGGARRAGAVQEERSAQTYPISPWRQFAPPQYWSLRFRLPRLLANIGAPNCTLLSTLPAQEAARETWSRRIHADVLARFPFTDAEAAQAGTGGDRPTGYHELRAGRTLHWRSPTVGMPGTLITARLFESGTGMRPEIAHVSPVGSDPYDADDVTTWRIVDPRVFARALTTGQARLFTPDRCRWISPAPEGCPERDEESASVDTQAQSEFAEIADLQSRARLEARSARTLLDEHCSQAGSEECAQYQEPINRAIARTVAAQANVNSRFNAWLPEPLPAGAFAMRPTSAMCDVEASDFHARSALIASTAHDVVLLAESLGTAAANAERDARALEAGLTDIMRRSNCAPYLITSNDGQNAGATLDAFAAMAFDLRLNTLGARFRSVEKLCECPPDQPCTNVAAWMRRPGQVRCYFFRPGSVFDFE